MLSRLSASQVGLVTISKYVRFAATTASTNSITPAQAILKAKMLTNPSLEYPATEGATDLADPRVFWREHWDAQTEKPYYENLVTRVTTFDIPQGMPTKFGSFYVRNGHNVIADLVQPKRSTASVLNTQTRNYSTSRHLKGLGAPPPPDADPSKLTMKQRIALYGTAGLVLYLLIHNFILLNMFIMLYVFEWDLVSIARNWGFELHFLGGKKAANAGECAADEEAEQKATEKITSDPSIFATFITAVALTKMMVPVQLTITLALAPTVAPRLNVLLNRLWVRMGYKVPAVTPPV